MLRYTLMFLAGLATLLSGLAIEPAPVFAQSNSCTVVSTQTFTNEQSARNGVTANANNVGVTILEAVTNMGGTSGQIFVLQAAQVGGVAQWYAQAGMVQQGNNFVGVLGANQAQKWIELNNANPNGDNPVTVILCQETGSISGTITIGATGNTVTTATNSGNTTTVTNTGGTAVSLPPTWNQNDAWAWQALVAGARSWCDGYIAPFDGTLTGATDLANQMLQNSLVTQTMVVTNQVSTRPGSTGITFLEVMTQLGVQDGQEVWVIPANAQSVCVPYWLAGINPADQVFTFFYNADATAAGPDRDFFSFTQVTEPGGIPVIVAVIDSSIDNRVGNVLP